MDKPIGLENPTNCDDLLARLRGDALRQLEVRKAQVSKGLGSSDFSGWGGSPGFGGMGGGPAGDDIVQRFVETNLSAKGADEADIAKAQGNGLFVIASGKVHAFSLSEDEKFELGSSLTVSGRARDLLAGGDHVLTFSTEGRRPTGDETASLETCKPGISCRAHTLATLYKMTSSGGLVVEKEYLFEGEYMGARSAQGFARLLLDAKAQSFKISPPDLELLDPFGLPYADDELESQVDAWASRLEEAIEASDLTDWLPKSYERTALDWEMLPFSCENYYVPNTDLETKGHTRVISLDLNGEETPQAISITGSTNLVYHNNETLLLAYVDPRFSAGLIEQSQTALHYLSFNGAGKTTYVASGLIPGVIHNRYSMHEAEGTVLLSSTIASRVSSWSVKTENRVMALQIKGEKLSLVGSTPPMAEGEDIYATRFIGDRAYVVTFREIDPLFIVDISDPNRPAVTGEVEVAGFSEYVHPLDENNLITIGRIGSRVQLQLFDVSRSNPVRTFQEIVGDYYSESAAGKDPRKFSFNEEYGIASFPMRPRYSGYWYASRGVHKMVNYNATAEDGIRLNSEVVHSCWSGGYYEAPCARGQAEMFRTIQGEDTSYIISEVGVSVHALPTFDLVDSAAFSSKIPFIVDIEQADPDGMGGAGGGGGAGGAASD